MKKVGKFERRKDASSAKQPKMNSILLQTYFTSLFSLVLCVSLFLGTSYAWFTSEVTSTQNEIYVGTMKVGLAGKNGRDLAGTDNKLFDQNVRWEPGYTTLDSLNITNQGDLAFKYVLSFTDGSLSGGNTTIMDDVAECFEVWVYDQTDKNLPNLDSYADVNKENGWHRAGFLNELLAGTPVLSGELDIPANDDHAGHTYIVALHMKEDASADVMGCKIKLNVKLVAYQKVSETDAFGNSEYDKLTPVTDAETLTAALDKNENAILATDLVIGSADDILSMSKGVLDGGENTISYTGGKDADGNPVGVMTASGGTIQNLNIKAGDNGIALCVGELTRDLVVIDSYFTGSASFVLNSDVKTDHTVTFTDTQFVDNVSYGNGMEHAYFEDCTFSQLVTAGGTTTMTGCRFEWKNLDLSKLKSGESVTLVDCDYDGVHIARAVLTAGSDGITIEETDALIMQNTMVVTK